MGEFSFNKRRHKGGWGMKESDWKKFKVIKEKAIEQFCTQALDEFEEVMELSDEFRDQTDPKRFGWE